jgi:hypothetical protein
LKPEVKKQYRAMGVVDIIVFQKSTALGENFIFAATRKGYSA